MRKLLAALFGLLILAAPVGAQDRPVSINVGAGPLMPLGGFKDAFNTGAPAASARRSTSRRLLAYRPITITTGCPVRRRRFSYLRRQAG